MRENDLKRFKSYNLNLLEKELDAHTRAEITVDQWTAFSWSVSRHHTFEQCKRKYYLTYYGARRVRQARSPIVGSVWWLKQVTGVKALTGTLIHNLAQDVLRAHQKGQTQAKSIMVAGVVSEFATQVEASRRGAKHDRRWVVLFDHVYETGYDPADEVDRVKKLAEDFFESSAYQFVKSLSPKSVVEVDEPFQSFMLEHVTFLGDVKIFAIPDAVLHDGELMHIIDWKTGSVDKPQYATQAGIYRYYAQRAYGLRENKIRVALGDLADTGELVQPVGTVPSVEDAETFIRESISKMVDRMESTEFNTVAIANFPMIDDLDQCAYCAFKRACWRE